MMQIAMFLRGTAHPFKYHNGFGSLAANPLVKLTLPAAYQPALSVPALPSSAGSRTALIGAARRVARLVAVAAAISLAGCSASSSLREYIPQIVTPYRIDIQQGNFVTQDLVDKLQAGQTRDQVRFILGTPMLADVFHSDRWDYVFRSAKGWNDPEKRRLTVFFDKGEKLAKWEAIAVPPRVDITGGAGTAGATVSAATLPPLESPGLFGRLFGSSPPKSSNLPVASVSAPEAAPAEAIVPPLGAIAGAGNVMLASSAPPPAAPASPVPKPAAEPPAISTDEKRGVFGRMFGWMSPSASTASTAASAATAATAASAATSAMAAAAAPPAPAAAAAPAVAAATPAPVPEPAPVVAQVSPPAAPPPVPATAASAPVPPSPAPALPAAGAPPLSVGPPPDTAAIFATITESVEQWRAAWSDRNLANYLAAYAPDFKPAGMTRARWEAQRTERLAKPVFIFVNVFEPQITIANSNTATVVFTQQYETEALKQTGRKTLVFGQINGKWLIREESFSAN